MKDSITLDETTRIKSAHASVEVTADPLVHDLDELELGKGPAAAIRNAIADGIKGITERASDATIRKRAAARKALAKGEAWAVERYRGRQPAQSDRLFNDSGALANGLTVVAQQDGSLAIVAPANRGENPEAFDGSEMARMQAKLVDLVPALQDPTNDPKVRAAIEASAGKVVRTKR